MIQLDSRLHRSLWLVAAFNTVPDFAIAGALAYFTTSGAIGFVAFFIGLQILYLLIWVKNSAWGWVTFAWHRKAAAQALCDTVRAFGMPIPDGHFASVEAYLMSIGNDEDQPVRIRLAAAGQLGSLSYPNSQGRFVETLRATLLYEDALALYARQATSTTA